MFCLPTDFRFYQQKPTLKFIARIAFKVWNIDKRFEHTLKKSWLLEVHQSFEMVNNDAGNDSTKRQQ
jgi:hypothetical protein